MKTVIGGLVLFAAFSSVWAQQANEPVRRSSSPSGMRIQDGGPAMGAASSASSAAPSSPAERGGAQDQVIQSGGAATVQIQGNTNVKANVRNLNSAAVGVNNAARNEVGAIGK